MTHTKSEAKQTEGSLQSIESIQYKILVELSSQAKNEEKLLVELKYYREQLLSSFENEKKLIQTLHDKQNRIKELEKENKVYKVYKEKYDKLKNSAIVRLAYTYWNLRKKLSFKRK
ncbi:hypothetical protein NC797_03165 [Aquibacillus sp. 3ASR75-11]|uniref:Uncharacterized protein n=1 Tax=Terrihalobacillus insolitus TaxID=2950438 RepID=A0A9X4AKV4_9BACI|nr:hypothetical protein [Terrihalobacillus insolitus]MDC3411827.1 hypothetical protein [Terrihalobacillus insolitus]MDC3423506.1 hypothetical protein [Terrihalobacillus insolitus]